MTDEEKKKAKRKAKKAFYMKVWRESNKEEIETYKKDYHEAHKEEVPIKHKAWSRTIDGLISQIYRSQKQHSKKRGHQPPTYSQELLLRWMTAHVIFKKLYDNWIASDYDRWLIPSVDRLDNSKGYSFDNIQLMTWKENDAKQRYRNINN